MTDLPRYPSLLFLCPLRKTNSFLRGILELQYDGTNVIFWPAASGVRGHQHDEELWHRNYGPIPLSRLIKDNYSVSTEKIYSPKSQSEAFHITPDLVFSLADLQMQPGPNIRMRSQLLIHRRGKRNGTNGCIEICEDSDFDDFTARMAELRNSGVPFLPLWVMRSASES